MQNGESAGLALWVIRDERSVGLGAESLEYRFQEIRLSGLLRDRGCIDHGVQRFYQVIFEVVMLAL